MMFTGLHISAMIMVMGQKSSMCPVVAKKSYFALLTGKLYSVAKRNMDILGNWNQSWLQQKIVRNNRWTRGRMWLTYALSIAYIDTNSIYWHRIIFLKILTNAKDKKLPKIKVEIRQRNISKFEFVWMNVNNCE